MGDLSVRKIKGAEDRKRMYRHALEDIEAFEMLLKEQRFESGPPKIGAEQELCIVDSQMAPSTSALELLDAIADEHYTNELALFNLEINLDPLPLSGNCFSRMETDLLSLLAKGKEQASQLDTHLLMTGILPTLEYRHLQFEYMTPVRRYKTLSQTLSELRGAEFEIYLQGVDELMMSLRSVLFEACNTSFQLHLQINPEEFVDRYNWAQMIAGPVLSACVNSPMLFGRELWAETRIALFKQSLDTRSAQKFLRSKKPRVYFGNHWLQQSAAELWKNDLTRFPLLVTSDDFEDAKTVMESGAIPNLRAIRLHNGTTYTWNRLCYGYSKQQPHLRIECRYLPAGPTAVDEIANFAFWIGLMNSVPPKGRQFWKSENFKVTKNNFIKAARTGLHTVFQWFGQHIPAKQLLLEELLPMAWLGLSDCGVADPDIHYYLGIIQKRIESGTTGSDWTIRNFRKLSDRYGRVVTQQEMVKQTLHYQKENIPLYRWKDLDASIHPISKQEPTVEELMSRDIYTVNENDSLEMVGQILEWNAIHHLPVEGANGDLQGMITDGIIERLNENQTESPHSYAKDIMLVNLVTIQAHETIKEAQRKMQVHQLSGLPVVYGKKLVGMITDSDFKTLFKLQ